MNSDEVVIVEFEENDLSGATVVAGFPSIGLVSTIIANYMIDSFGLTQIGALESPHFPTLSVVHTGEPLCPVRIYAGNLESGTKLVIFVSEFKPKPHLINSISNEIINWVKEKGCAMIISPEGMVVENATPAPGTNPLDENHTSGAYAIGSTNTAREYLETMHIPMFKNGIIAGVSGVLLNRGKHENLDVVSILSEAHPNYPDARAAASAINVIATLLETKVNVGPLYEEAERIEQQLQKFHKQAKPMTTGATQIPQANMYG